MTKEECQNEITKIFEGISDEDILAYLSLQGKITVNRLAWTHLKTLEQQDEKDKNRIFTLFDKNKTDHSFIPSMLRLLDRAIHNEVANLNKDEYKKAREAYEKAAAAWAGQKDPRSTRKALAEVFPYIQKAQAIFENDKSHKLSPVLRLNAGDAYFVSLLGEVEGNQKREYRRGSPYTIMRENKTKYGDRVSESIIHLEVEINSALRGENATSNRIQTNLRVMEGKIKELTNELDRHMKGMLTSLRNHPECFEYIACDKDPSKSTLANLTLDYEKIKPFLKEEISNRRNKDKDKKGFNQELINALNYCDFKVHTDADCVESVDENCAPNCAKVEKCKPLKDYECKSYDQNSMTKEEKNKNSVKFKCNEGYYAAVISKEYCYCKKKEEPKPTPKNQCKVGDGVARIEWIENKPKITCKKGYDKAHYDGETCSCTKEEEKKEKPKSTDPIVIVLDSLTSEQVQILINHLISSQGSSSLSSSLPSAIIKAIQEGKLTKEHLHTICSEYPEACKNALNELNREGTNQRGGTNRGKPSSSTNSSYSYSYTVKIHREDIIGEGDAKANLKALITEPQLGAREKVCLEWEASEKIPFISSTFSKGFGRALTAEQAVLISEKAKIIKAILYDCSTGKNGLELARDQVRISDNAIRDITYTPCEQRVDAYRFSYCGGEGFVGIAGRFNKGNDLNWFNSPLAPNI